MNAIKETRQNHYTAGITRIHKDTERYYDLTNESIISTEFNLKMDEVWSHGPHWQRERPFPFIICTTLNLWFIDSPTTEGYLLVSGKTAFFPIFLKNSRVPLIIYQLVY